MNEDKMTILRMIEKGTITAEEGKKLFEAIEEEPQTSQQGKATAKWIRIRVKKPGEDNNINIKVPAKIIEFGFKLGTQMGAVQMEDVDFDRLRKMIEAGELGEVMEIQTDDGHIINITLE